LTITTIDAEPDALLESVAVAVTVYVPAVVYVRCTLVVLPVNVCLALPSPKSTASDVIALPDVGVAPIVKVVDAPTVGLAVDDEIVTASWDLGPTMTWVCDEVLPPFVSRTSAVAV